MSKLLKRVFIVAMFGVSALTQAAELKTGSSDEKMFVGSVHQKPMYHFPSKDKDGKTCFYKSEIDAIIHTAYVKQKHASPPDCAGLTQEQLASINFDEIVFPEDYVQRLPGVAKNPSL